MVDEAVSGEGGGSWSNNKREKLIAKVETKMKENKEEFLWKYTENAKFVLRIVNEHKEKDEEEKLKDSGESRKA